MKIETSVLRGPKEGFALFELLLVIAIISISLAIVAIALTPGLHSVEIRTAARKVAASLAQARNLAVSKGRSYYVHVSEDGLKIMASDGTVEKSVYLPHGLRMNVSGGSTVSFYPRGGSSGGRFEILDTGDGGMRHSIAVDPATGRVRVL